MATLALVLGLLYVVAVFAVHPLLLQRRTGHSAWAPSMGATRWEKAANVLFLVGCGLDVANPALAVAGVVRPATLPVPDAAVTSAAVTGYAVALALSVLAQRVMRESWRTGIDPLRRTPLVTSGPFRVIRNPTYTALVACSVTLALLVPTLLGALAVVTCLVALQVQTRLVEEPHLRRVHGEAYRRYAARVGRFLPGIGQLPAGAD